jgi:hypothetical protein
MERVTTQTLLGIRFWDPVIAQPIGRGLLVTAQLLNADRTQRVGRRITGTPMTNGVYAFFGLRTAERPDADQTLWESVPPTRFAAIDVSDPVERYLPVSFLVRTPFRGPFLGTGDWLPQPLLLPETAAAAAPGVYLWSAAGRPTPAGMTIIQGQLVTGTATNPSAAPFAVVRVLSTASTIFAVGMTDAAGRLTLPMPYPAIPDPPNNEPYPSLDRQQFDLTITVSYEPDAQTLLPQSTTPDLSALLRQAPAQIAILHNPSAIPGVSPDTFAPELSIQLPYGRPFVLRTPIQGTARGQPFLRIQPAP